VRRKLHEPSHVLRRWRLGIQMHNLRSVIRGAEPLAEPQASIFVSEFPLNPHESFRAEIIDRQGKSIVSISRWKSTPAGLKRTGISFEFGAHRTAAVTNLLIEVQRVFNALNPTGGAS
jgi:hypothetical protein